MPLVNGEMCPIAVDVVQKAPQTVPPQTIAPQKVAPQTEEIIYDHPIVEKAEHHDVHSEKEDLYDDHSFEEEEVAAEPLDFHFDSLDYHDDDYFDDPDRIVPMKHEHHQDEAERFWDLEQEDDDRVLPTKSEHTLGDVHRLHKDLWQPEFHTREETLHSNEQADGISEDLLEVDEAHESILKPRTPRADDPRLKIPKGKAGERPVAPAPAPAPEPAPTAEHKTEH